MMVPAHLQAVPWPAETAEEALAALRAAVVHAEAGLHAHRRLVDEHTAAWAGHQARVFAGHTANLDRIGAGVVDLLRASIRAVMVAADTVAHENAERAVARRRWREERLRATES